MEIYGKYIFVELFSIFRKNNQFLSFPDSEPQQ